MEELPPLAVEGTETQATAAQAAAIRGLISADRAVTTEANLAPVDSDVGRECLKDSSFGSARLGQKLVPFASNTRLNRMKRA